MNTKVTLGEKLKDLRNKEEGKQILAVVSEATGISVSTLQRLEADDDIRVGYQDIETLARYYDVSTDYLFGLTDNKQHRNIEIDKLHLTDEAIEVLKDGQLNNRLISEFIAHADFPKLLSAMEIYIDRKVMPQMNAVSTMYKFTEELIKSHHDVADNDEAIAFLQQSVVDEDEYLRYRISERFNEIMKRMFDAHRADALPIEQAEAIKEMKETAELLLTVKKDRGTTVAYAKMLGLDFETLTDEEIALLTKALSRSEKFKVGQRMRGRPTHGKGKRK